MDVALLLLKRLRYGSLFEYIINSFIEPNISEKVLNLINSCSCLKDPHFFIFFFYKKNIEKEKKT